MDHRVDSGYGSVEPVAGEHVPANGLDPVGPRRPVLPAEDTDVLAGRHQPWHERSTEPTGGPCDEDEPHIEVLDENPTT